MHLNGQKFSGVLEQLSVIPKFLGYKCKIDHFEEKTGLSVVYMKLKCWRLQTGLTDLKNIKQLKFCIV